MSKKILMIAGPNGAGKTTICLELMKAQHQTLYDFINADEIAKGLAPLHPESVSLAASKLMVKRLKELLEGHRSFAFETTASGVNYVKHLQHAKSMGYEISLTFLWLDSPQQAVERVSQRVKQGGHHVPTEVVIRRYYAGIRHLQAHYLPLADTALIIDNSSQKSMALIAKKDGNSPLNILNETLWKKLTEAANER